MSKREWILLGVSGTAVLAISLLVGVVTDRLILARVSHGPPQRLAAAMAGLFAGGLLFFAGMMAWFLRRPPE